MSHVRSECPFYVFSEQTGDTLRVLLSLSLYIRVSSSYLIGVLLSEATQAATREVANSPSILFRGHAGDNVVRCMLTLIVW